ncbi:MAG: tetratricopeptide repeat protein [Bacteroidia bacterium]
MQHNKENSDDLGYLAELGYEKAVIDESDINDLRKRIRSQSFSYNSGGYFGVISLLTGVFLGISVFFLFHNSSIIFPATKPITIKANKTQSVTYSATLDTVHITYENFINPASGHKATHKEITSIQRQDTITVSNIPLSTFTPEEEIITEAKIKYIPNSPVIFLHDMKITDYSSLYFKLNRFVSLKVNEGLDPSYANVSETGKNDNMLMPEAHYYLHQAISDAMLYFSRKEYTRCLNTLQIITDINPGDINCKFYSGMCYFYKKDFIKALKQFEDCINDQNNTFLNEARYYKAMCLYNNGDKEEAAILFKEISNEGSFYSEKARQLLKQD